MDNKSLSHTKWKCQYHIVFIPKYRKKILYGRVRNDVREIISTLCKYKDPVFSWKIYRSCFKLSFHDSETFFDFPSRTSKFHKQHIYMLIISQIRTNSRRKVNKIWQKNTGFSRSAKNLPIFNCQTTVVISADA